MGSTEGNFLANCSYISGESIKTDTSLSLVPGMPPFCYNDNPNAFTPVVFTLIVPIMV